MFEFETVIHYSFENSEEIFTGKILCSLTTPVNRFKRKKKFASKYNSKCMNEIFAHFFIKSGLPIAEFYLCKTSLFSNFVHG